jgi:hypothetical protein
VNALERLAGLASRFQGADLAFRRDGTNWPEPWRARLLSSKHAGVRITVYAASAEAAIQALCSAASDGAP